jgi:tetratricopeptide (TPR) repeat protein
MNSIAKWERWFLLSLFIFSLALRLFYLSEIRHNPFFEHPRLDALYHDTWAQSIASGNIIGDEVFFRAPLYPYLLGLVYAVFGHNYLISRVIQHLLGSLTVILLYFLARRLYSPKTAVIASLLAATYAIVIYFEGELLFDSLLLFLCVALFFLIYRRNHQPTFRSWFQIGLLFGIICITRPPFLPFLIPLVGYTIFLYRKPYGWQKTRVAIIALVAGTATLIVPVTVRNYAVGKDFVLIASQGGINFYIGNNPGANGYSSMMPGALGVSWENKDADFHAQQELGYPAKPSEISDYWYRKGLQFIKGNPLQFVQLTAKKLYLFWNQCEIPNNQSFYSFQQYSSLLRLLPTGFWLIGPLGLLGMCLTHRGHPARFMVMFILFCTLMTIAFFVCDRYRLPIIPFLCIFSAHTIITFYKRVQNRSRSWFIRQSMLLILFFAIVNSSFYPLEKESKAQDLLRLGIVELDQGHYENATAYLKLCASAGKIYPNLFLNWGVCELMLGKQEEAVEKFHEELQYFPLSYGALANLAYVYYQQHQVDSVILYASDAIGEKPYAAAGYIYLAKTYYEQRNLLQAESVLVIGAAKCGNDFLYGEYLLAGIQLQSGKIAEAESTYRFILQHVKPDMQPFYEPEFGFARDYTFGENHQLLHAKSLYGLGHVFASRDQIDSAIVYFRAATSVQSNYADAWIDLGIALHRSRRLPEADSAFNVGLKNNPNNYLYWYSYGLLLGSMHRWLDEQRALEKSLAINPNFIPAQEQLGLIRSRQK